MSMKAVEQKLDFLARSTEGSLALRRLLRGSCGRSRPGVPSCNSAPTIVLYREAYCYECAKEELVNGDEDHQGH